MAFIGNEGAQISLEEGAQLTKRFRDAYPESGKGVAYGRIQIETLLAQPGCNGIRMYFAKEVDGGETLVLVGVDANGNDMLNLIIESGKRCPTECGANNALNTDYTRK